MPLILTEREKRANYRRRSTFGTIVDTKAVRQKLQDQHHQRHDVVKIINCRVLQGNALVEKMIWIENGKVIDPFQRFFSSKTSEDYQPDVIIDGKGNNYYIITAVTLCIFSFFFLLSFFFSNDCSYNIKN